MTIYGIGGTGEQLPYEHKGTAMTEKEVKQKVVEWLHNIWPTIDEHYTKEEIESSVNKFLPLYKQAGYVRLAQDQSLPVGCHETEFCNGRYIETQVRAMLKANFRKIEKEVNDGYSR